jgi:putative membrane protein
MKKAIINAHLAGFLFFGAALSLASCSGDNKTEDPKETAEEINDSRFEERENEKDAQFLVEAATINMKEIELGKLAQQKGTMADTKKLGMMMEKEHTKALGDLKALAMKKNVELPMGTPEEAQDGYNKLNEKTGADFDKEYADMMVKGHKDAIDKFEKASGNAEDADIRNWASSMLPSLQMHLDESNKLQEMTKKAK